MLISLAALSAWESWGPLHNLFEDYQDSPVWVYLVSGLPFMAVALGCLAGAAFLLRRR